MSARIEIDGSKGEGGGQILRTALGLALVTGRPFQIRNIRARRKNPGLMRQHLAAVRAAAGIGQATVRGAALGSSALEFEPGGVKPGEFRFDTGSAGSVTLVLQTVLPALIAAAATSRLVLRGGTHNPFAPPAEFLERSFCPILAHMGPKVRIELRKHGFFPAGGGEIEVTVEPAGALGRLELMERGAARSQSARAIVSRLPSSIAERELRVLRQKLAWPDEAFVAQTVADSPGPGNAILLEMAFEAVTEVVTAFGSRGMPAESVAHAAGEEARRYLASDAPVGPHLADQLLAPMALAGGGIFRATELTPHAVTNIETVQRFIDVPIQTLREPGGAWRVSVGVR